jgi:hypothetical protein
LLAKIATRETMPVTAIFSLLRFIIRDYTTLGDCDCCCRQALVLARKPIPPLPPAHRCSHSNSRKRFEHFYDLCIKRSSIQGSYFLGE